MTVMITIVITIVTNHYNSFFYYDYYTIVIYRYYTIGYNQLVSALHQRQIQISRPLAGCLRQAAGWALGVTPFGHFGTWSANTTIDFFPES